MVQILCTHVCKWENDTCVHMYVNEKIPRMEGGEIKHDIFDTL
jgi:hypothetical protein